MLFPEGILLLSAGRSKEIFGEKTRFGPPWLALG
jgi:hypothetical protein